MQSTSPSSTALFTSTLLPVFKSPYTMILGNQTLLLNLAILVLVPLLKPH